MMATRGAWFSIELKKIMFQLFLYHHNNRRSIVFYSTYRDKAKVVMPLWQQKVPKILTYTLPKDCLNIPTKVRA